MTRAPEILEVEGWSTERTNEIIRMWQEVVPGRAEYIVRTLAPFCAPSYRMKGGDHVGDASIDNELWLFDVARIESWNRGQIRRGQTKFIEIKTLGFMLLRKLKIEPALIMPANSPIARPLWTMLHPNLQTIWRNCRGTLHFPDWVYERFKVDQSPTAIEEMLQAALADTYHPTGNFREANLCDMVHCVIWLNFWVTAFSFCLLESDRRDDVNLLPLLERFKTKTVPLGFLHKRPHTFVYFEL